MAAVFRNGKWVDDAEDPLQQQPSAATALADMPAFGASPIDAANQQIEQDAQLKQKQQRAEFQKNVAEGGDNRPFWAKDAGQALGDVGKITANALAAIPTDIADLAAGIGDVAVQTGAAIQGKGFDIGQVFNDSDNPWTQWRRNEYKPGSQAGQTVSNLVRIATQFIAFPKLVAATPFNVAKLAVRAGEVEKAKGVGLGITTLATKLGELVVAGEKAQQSEKVGAALNVISKGFQKKTAAAKVVEIAAEDKWLFATYKAVTTSVDKAGELSKVGTWMDDTYQSARALTQLSKGSRSARIATVGQALAWDMFVTFNAYGEGDSQFDETLGDMAASSNMPWLRQIGSLTATNVEDTGLVRKAKQMFEGLATGIVLNSALDMIRVGRFAKNYRKATPDERALIIEAMNVDSQEIGNSIGRTLVSDSGVQGRRMTMDLTPEALKQLDADRQAANAGRREAFLDAQAARERAAAGQGGAPAAAVDLQAQAEKQPLYQQWQQSRQAPAVGDAAAPAAAPAAGPAATDIPFVKVRSTGNQQSAAQSLMSWINAGLPEDQWLVKTEEEALRLVQAKGASPDWNKISSVDFDAAANDRAMGRGTANTEAMRDIYARFYGVGGKGVQAKAAPAVAKAAPAGPGTLKEYEAWLTKQAQADPAAAQALQQFKVMEAQVAQTGPGGQIVPFEQGPRPPTEGLPADPSSPVQQRLAQMEGLASQLDEDPLYQQWLSKNAAPLADQLPPAAPGSPALDQFRGLGPTPTDIPGAATNDLAAYQAWLEANARMPDGTLNPQVQASLRRLEGIGELAIRPPAPGPGGLAQSPGIEPVRVGELRPRDAGISPVDIRTAFERDAFSAWKQAQELTFVEGPDGVMRSVAKGVEQLMPTTRVDVLDYLKNYAPVPNEYGVITASDSVWTNFIYDKALAEGWASIDPDTMAVRFNRTNALQLDRGEIAQQQAQALDEIRYQEWLWNKSAVNGQGEQLLPPPGPVQDNLAAKEVRTAYDQWEAKQAADRAGVQQQYDQWEGRPGAPDGQTVLQDNAAAAGARADAFDNTENLRLSQADVAKLDGKLTDEEAVRQFAGTTLDSIEPPMVQKVETGRGWEVISRDGEPLGTARTKGAADKIAAQQLEQDRRALLNKARQLEADNTDEALGQQIGAPIYDGSIVGKIELTDAQIRSVQGISEQLDGLLDDAWLQKRGSSAFYNVNELGPQKRTFELEQGDMTALRDALRSAIDNAGALKGSQRLRALKNLSDKLDVQMKLLEPQARAQRFVDNLLADVSQFVEHGEFCN
jgi:hypothetical protein